VRQLNKRRRHNKKELLAAVRESSNSIWNLREVDSGHYTIPHNEKLPMINLSDPRVANRSKCTGMNRTDARRLIVKEDLVARVDQATSMEDLRAVLEMLIHHVNYV